MEICNSFLFWRQIINDFFLPKSVVSEREYCNLAQFFTYLSFKRNSIIV